MWQEYLFNNLVMKFEEYANMKEGMRFETIWRLKWRTLGDSSETATMAVFEKLLQREEDKDLGLTELTKAYNQASSADEYAEEKNYC